jgi:hypothetical protein
MEKSYKVYADQYTRSPLVKERFKLLKKIENIAEIPFAILGLVWINLLIFYTIYGHNNLIEFSSAILILFQFELIIKIYLAPSALIYIKKNPAGVASAMFPFIRFVQTLQKGKMKKNL